MAAMKPRTGDGPLEVTKEGRGIVMRVPLEGGGRLVVELNADEAGALGDALKDVVADAPLLPEQVRPPALTLDERNPHTVAGADVIALPVLPGDALVLGPAPQR